TLNGYIETMLVPQISMVNNVAQVTNSAWWRYAVRVQVDPNKLYGQGIGINEVDQALQNWNVNLPTGQLQGRSAVYNIKTGGQLNNAAEFRQIVVSHRNGIPVHLSDVANVLDSVEDTHNASWFYTKENRGLERTMTVNAMRQPGSNVVE